MPSGVFDPFIHLSDGLVNELDGALTMPSLVGLGTFKRRTRLLQVGVVPRVVES